MNIGILGTGGVAQTLAAHLAAGGHSIVLGTRDVATTQARAGTDGQPFAAWLAAQPGVRLDTLAGAAAHGSVLLNATAGHASLASLAAAGEAHLNGKILLDIANPLDFSHGMPPSLFVANTDSLAEQIQRQFPALKVVKTLNTLTAALMVNPRLLAEGDHHLFLSGNDAAAKATVRGYLQAWFGWQHIIDLGDITTARGTEMLLPVWIRLWGALQTPMFNFKIVQN
ncbi:MAG: NAD(P)-binding domain-containing protein [Anaerolineae bacterium]|nr:NAD(P)-binding domain-containing protein [Anaerolineae bacterium]